MALNRSEDEAAVAALAAMRPPRTSTTNPTVSIVVHGGSPSSEFTSDLRERTSYPNIKVVLVTDRSTEEYATLTTGRDAGDLPAESAPGQAPLEALRQGPSEAHGELVLLLEDGYSPVNPDWLGHMVDALTPDVAAVGAMLVRSDLPGSDEPTPSPRLSVEHLGIEFVRQGDTIHGAAAGLGIDPLTFTEWSPRDVAAATTACLLARRSDVVDVGGLGEYSTNGPGSWDLSLRLGRMGRVVVEPKAVLIDHRRPPDDDSDERDPDENESRDHRRFLMAWGPPLLRRMLLERLGSSPRLVTVERRPRVCFLVDQQTPSAGAALIEAWHTEACETGWESSIAPEPPDSPVDLIITTTPTVQRAAIDRALLSIAIPLSDLGLWVRSGTLDAVDLILATSSVNRARIDAAFTPSLAVRIDVEEPTDQTRPFERVVAAAKDSAADPLVAITTCVPDEPRMPFWGDTYFARSLGRGCAEIGARYRDLIQSEWASLRFAACDATIHLRGITPRTPWPAQQNALWFISHPSRIVDGECDGFDVVASASEQHARELSEELGREVLYLPQATDPHIFSPGPRDVNLEADVLYVGSSRLPHRKAPRWMHRAGIDFHLYGKNWDSFPERVHLRSEFFPNDELGVLYRSAAIVVADHHPDMRAHGVVANRVFDILASGGFVISDDVAGLSELFDGAVPVYRNKDELIGLIRHYTENPAERRRLSAIGRRRVLEAHTFRHRAQVLLDGLRTNPLTVPIL